MHRGKLPERQEGHVCKGVPLAEGLLLASCWQESMSSHSKAQAPS